MGRESELFKAAKNGNNTFLERIFAGYLKKSHGFGSIRKRDNPNIQDDAGYTLLHHATLHGQRDTVSLLLRCGASTMIPDSSGSCPLHLAAWKGDLEIVTLLVNQGPSRANVNQQSDSDDTALHLASQYGYSDVVEFLLQRHADPLLTNVKGETPLDLAAQYGHLDTVHLIISHCPEILQLTRHEFSPLHLAARNGHTLIALSLINAGISVNTVCERGTALHEAAMCGKGETVQLLLDKGVSLELKDGKERSVLDLLAEFPAERAKEIRRMIEESRSHSTQPRQLRNRNIIAVAQTTCTPVTQDSGALAFKKGDTIVVQRRSNRDVFIGTVHGKCGSFLAQDVIFFKEKNGQMVLTDVTRLSRSSSSEDETSPPLGRMKMSISTKPPYAHIPAFPTEEGPPDSVSMGIPVPPPINARQQQDDSEKDHLEISVTLHNGEEEKADTSDKTKKSQFPIEKRLSKKEKRFQLKNDDGGYSELSPIDPQEAKREFGQSLRLNPVGPAFGRLSNGHNAQTVTAHNTGSNSGSPQFMGSYYVLEVGNFNSETEPETTSKEDGPQNSLAPPNSEIVGGYYMLDLKNFDEASEGVQLEAKTEEPPQRSGSSHSQQSYENVKVSSQSTAQQEESYYDTPKNVAQALRLRSPYMNIKIQSSSLPSYENIPLKPGQMKNDTALQRSSAPINVPQPTIASESRGRDCASASPTQPSSLPSYENIQVSPSNRGLKHVSKSQPGSRNHSPPLPLERSASAQGGTNFQQSESEGVRSAETNPRVSGLEDGDRSLSPPARSGGASPESIENEARAPRRADKHKRSKRREEIYEVVQVGGASGSQEDRRSPSDSNRADASLCEPSKSESTRNTTQSVADRNVEASGLTSEDHHGNSNEVEKRLNEHSAPVQKGRPLSVTMIIEDKENPFAGLVISASRQLEESAHIPVSQSDLRTKLVETKQLEPEAQVQTDQSAEGVPMRQRAETIWDDDRVQKEWSKIDTLLRDMRGALPASPIHQPPPVAKEEPSSNQSDSKKLFSWLQGLGLGGYASTLESNGFDCLKFLGGNILAMDDLTDIGITDQEDQYTIMAGVSLLPPPPPTRHPSSISEWLALLQLSHLEPKFTDFSLQRLSRLWDIELSSVVGIELLGYRKRLQYGIAELRSAHPGWERKEEPSASPPTARVHSSSPMEGVSFLKDYRNIKSTASPRTSRVEPHVVAMETAQPNDSLKLCSASPNTTLLKESVKFQAKYLGSVVVERVCGTQSTEEACLRLKTSTENMKKIPEIILAISWKGVKFVDAHTKNVVSTHAIRDVSYCSHDIEDKRVFAYITKDRGLNYCHVFMAPSKESSEEILVTIGQAFETAYQKVMRARIKASPHREDSPKREETEKQTQ